MVAAIRSRRAEGERRRWVGLVAALGLAALATDPAAAGKRLVDEPVAWYEDDRRALAAIPAERDPVLARDAFQASVSRPLGRFTNPVRWVRRAGTLFGGDRESPAINVNALDEALNSSWFTNRIGLFPMTPEDAARGPSAVTPSRAERWTVVGGKAEGVTPGFQIRDAEGRRFLIKFDPPGFSGMTTAAGVISARLLHAAGYFVPNDRAVTFTRDELVVGESVRFTAPSGEKRTMNEADLDALLARAPAPVDGRWLALASEFLPGRPIGPFDYEGRRKDDPNDRVDHEDRRELRGLRVFAEWINHYDTKQHNSLDMVVEEEGGRRYVRHHLIDFASTLGSGARGPTPRYGYEHTVDPPAFFGRLLSLGFHRDPWRRLRLDPELPEVGYFETEVFEPGEFKPLQPNTAFAHLTDRDGYWAAKILSAFTDEHLEAVVAEGGYRDPAAAERVVRVLAARRDAIVRHWFDRMPPLDFFDAGDGVVRYRDLGAERGLYPGPAPRYRARVAAADAGRGAGDWSPWLESIEPVLSLKVESLASRLAGEGAASRPFLAVEVAVDRGDGWSRSVRAYVARASGRVVAVER